MKTRLLLRMFAGVLFTGALSGCVTKPTAPTQSSGTFPNLAWDFHIRQMGEHPRGSVFLLVNGVPHKVVPIATANYEQLQRKEYKDYSVPGNAVIAAQSWHAGFGDIVYVLKKPGQLEVYRQEMDESETSRYPVKRVTVIPF